MTWQFPALPSPASLSVLRLMLALCLCCAAASRGAADGLRAGAARTCITPALGTRINGGLESAVARNIHDDLFAKALVLESGSNRLALVLVDTCLLDRPVVEEARDRIVREGAFRRSGVLIAATHTHSAGAVCGAHLTDADPVYRGWLPGRIADAVACAVNRLAPARLAWAQGSLPQHVFCRRLFVRPGMSYTNQLGSTHDLAKMNWDSPHPADGDPTGPVDPGVSVLSVRHADGRPLALLAVYALHYVGDVAPGDVSADYFGAFADRIQELLGADRLEPAFIGILANGTSGDVNNIDPRSPRAPAPPYTRIRAVADDLAREVLRASRDAVYREDVVLRDAWTELRVAVRRPTEAALEAARRRLGGRSNLSGWADNFAREQLLLAEGPEAVDVPLQVLRIGDVAVAAWPGEIFAASGLELKRRSPDRPVCNIGLANGWFGYIPPPEQFRYGAYETWTMRTSPLETNAVVRMGDALLGLVRSLE